MKKAISPIALQTCIFFAIVATLISSCQKETIEPTEAPIEQSIVVADTCDTCAIYCVTFTASNPTNTFAVFHNNNPTFGNFEMCSGDTLTWTMTQDCVAHGFCDQWTVEVMKDGEFFFGSASNAQTANHIYFVP